MIKVILMAVVGLVVGLGGSTGVLVMTAKPPIVAADSTHAAGADSSAHAVAGAAGSGHSEAAHASAPNEPGPGLESPPAGAHGPSRAATSAEPASHDPSGHGPPVETVVVPHDDGAPVTRPRGHRAPDTEPDAAGYKQVGNILGSMKPAEAVRILGYLSDDDVEGLLRSISPRQAASLLSAMSSERAAVLSRRLLRDRDGGGR